MGVDFASKGIKMFSKILYPTDFSDVAKRALDYIKKLKASGSEEVSVLHVIEEMSDLAAAELCDPVGPEESGIPAPSTPEFCDPYALEREAIIRRSYKRDIEDRGERGHLRDSDRISREK
jgi:nucleotide-binding universal stress UspA family protein